MRLTCCEKNKTVHLRGSGVWRAVCEQAGKRSQRIWRRFRFGSERERRRASGAEDQADAEALEHVDSAVEHVLCDEEAGVCDARHGLGGLPHAVVPPHPVHVLHVLDPLLPTADRQISVKTWRLELHYRRVSNERSPEFESSKTAFRGCLAKGKKGAREARPACPRPRPQRPALCRGSPRC